MTRRPPRSTPLSLHDALPISKVLATMRRDLELDCDTGELVLVPPDRSTLKEMFRRSEEHTSELQSPYDLVCRLLLEKKKKKKQKYKKHKKQNSMTYQPTVHNY